MPITFILNIFSTNIMVCGSFYDAVAVAYFEVLSKNFIEGPNDDLEKTSSRDSMSPVQDLNPGPPEYEVGLVPTRPRQSVIQISPLSIAVGQN
jgi:hypothetical protein